jgi:hypothetical protein
MDSTEMSRERRHLWRSRWAALGAAVAVTFGAGGLFAVSAASPESSVVTLEPVRILDTRDPVNVGLAGPFVSPAPQDLKVTGSVATTTGTKTVVPTGATGVFLNLTPVGSTAAGFISVRPANASGLPSTSNVNFTVGAINPNAVLVELPVGGDDDGKIEITFDAFGAAGPTSDVLVDVVGYTTEARLLALEAGLATKPDRTQTVTFSGRDLTGLGDFQTGSSNGCAVDLTGQSGILTLPIPVGATILNVTGTFYDTTGASVYTARLRKTTTGPTQDLTETLTTVTGGELSIATVSKDLTPPAETVDPGERFDVSFDDGVASFGNGLCSIAVTYREGAGPVALTAPVAEQSGSLECDDPATCRIETP